MAASSLMRLIVVFIILIALALSSGIAWGSFSLLDHTDPERSIRTVEMPNLPFSDDRKSP